MRSSTTVQSPRTAEPSGLAAPSRAQQERNREQRHADLRATRERRVRTRMLILLGSWVAANANDPAAQRVFAAMDGWLTRPQDRRLFDLPAKPS